METKAKYKIFERNVTPYSVSETILGYVDSLGDIKSVVDGFGAKGPRFRNARIVEMDIDYENDAADLAVFTGSDIVVLAVEAI